MILRNRREVIYSDVDDTTPFYEGLLPQEGRSGETYRRAPHASFLRMLRKLLCLLFQRSAAYRATKAEEDIKVLKTYQLAMEIAACKATYRNPTLH
jgi:hypothetical protein